MANPHENPAALEARVDAIVDAGLHSYDEARRICGMPEPDSADLSAEAIRARHPEWASAIGQTALSDETDNMHYAFDRQAIRQAFDDPTTRRINENGIRASLAEVRPMRKRA